MKNQYTPVMQQYLKIKEDYADAIVFFRLGDFYEMFFDDAKIASKVLEIALTSKSKDLNIPMCGVPYHAAKPYIQKLVSKGFKIAIAEQMSEPQKGLVERKVVKLITPGMLVDDGLIDDSDYNFIATISLSLSGYILIYTDISTGDAFFIQNLDIDSLFDQILLLNIKEVVLPDSSNQMIVNFLNSNEIALSISNNTMNESNEFIDNLQSKELKDAAKILVSYLLKSQMHELVHLLPFEEKKLNDIMHIDHKVNLHLEITQSNTNKQSSTLLHWIDSTKTAMGSRLLKHFITHPLRDQNQIESRYDYIESFDRFDLRESLGKQLEYVYDIYRIISRISLFNANAKDLYYLKETLSHVPEIKKILAKFEKKNIEKLIALIDDHKYLHDLLDKSIKEDAPLSIKEGDIIKEGYDQQLDEIKDISINGHTWLKDFEEKERQKTGIKNLKVSYNRVFGYYIEVSKGNIPLIKDEYGYIRKQTLTNNERYITEELKEKETILLSSKERANRLEFEIFQTIRNECAKFTQSLQTLASILAHVDVYLSFATTSYENRYIRPKFNKNKQVDLVLARHPVVEHHIDFVANSVYLKPNDIFIITGPNMSGKSTYMRMYALIVIMAQSGMFIPAQSANLTIYDAIFTRIGSSDDISSGQSTFMVEMTEANEALKRATTQSLILFDEIGRGTATYDGLALAQGMIEYINKNIKCHMMFSTHYHELCTLANTSPNIINIHVKAKEEKDKMIFLHQVELGASDRSYGIQVASLAHLPESLIKRSKQLLKKLESNTLSNQSNLFSIDDDDSISNIVPKELINLMEEIEKIDINQLTPLDALIRLQYLKKLIKDYKKEE